MRDTSVDTVAGFSNDPARCPGRTDSIGALSP